MIAPLPSEGGLYLSTPVTSATGSVLPAFDLGKTALFLDFDGTLAPIVDRPDLAALPSGFAPTLDRLWVETGGALAILSGRGLDEIDRLLTPRILPAAGSHGLERRDSAGQMSIDIDGAEALEAAADALEAFANSESLLFERKPCGVALHFRMKPDLEDRSRRFADDVAGTTPELRVIHGSMVAEITLSGKDKGRALAAFMGEPPFQGRMPFAAGDDVTDEDAFLAAQQLGGGGLKIGRGKTHAIWRVQNISEFHMWLSGLAVTSI
jgi:trehalose 6-phosphate phosphatase